jgi:hypothetical protein
MNILLNGILVNHECNNDRFFHESNRKEIELVSCEEWIIEDILNAPSGLFIIVQKKADFL